MTLVLGGQYKVRPRLHFVHRKGAPLPPSPRPGHRASPRGGAASLAKSDRPALAAPAPPRRTLALAASAGHNPLGGPARTVTGKATTAQIRRRRRICRAGPPPEIRPALHLIGRGRICFAAGSAALSAAVPAEPVRGDSQSGHEVVGGAQGRPSACSASRAHIFLAG